MVTAARSPPQWAEIRRQMPIASYVIDFCCEAARLIIELDGGQHSEISKEDAKRTAVLQAHGYLVLRFWNNDVLRNIDGRIHHQYFEAGPPSP
jgi:very-short-patch-repair endonuclease